MVCARADRAMPIHRQTVNIDHLGKRERLTRRSCSTRLTILQLSRSQHRRTLRPISCAGRAFLMRRGAPAHLLARAFGRTPPLSIRQRFPARPHESGLSSVAGDGSRGDAAGNSSRRPAPSRRGREQIGHVEGTCDAHTRGERYWTAGGVTPLLRAASQPRSTPVIPSSVLTTLNSTRRFFSQAVGLESGSSGQYSP